MTHFYLPVTQASQLSASLGKSASPLGFHPKDPCLSGPAPSLRQPPGLVPFAPVLSLLCLLPRQQAAQGREDVQSSLWEPALARWPCAVSRSGCKAILSQLQALSIPGPATMLYCLFPSAGRCRCSTCGCPELLALGIRDERPVTPRFMGRVWEASMLGCFCILWTIFLCLISHFCHPPPQFFSPLSMISLREVVGLRCHLMATLGERATIVRRVCLQLPPATQLTVDLAVVFSLFFPLYISQGWIPLGGEFDSIGILHRPPSAHPPPPPTNYVLSRSPTFSGSFPSAWSSLGMV